MSSSENHSVVNKLQSISVQVSLNMGEGDLVEYLKHTYGLRIRSGDFAPKTYLKEGAVLSERGATAGWNSYLRGQCLPCTQAGREGILTSKSRGEMLFLSLTLLVPHAKRFSFCISASDHKQGYQQLNERFSISFQREMEGDSSAINSTSGILRRSGQNFGTGILTETFLDHFCRQRCSVTRYCGEGGHTGCLPGLLPDKCQYFVALTWFSIRNSWWKYLATSAQGSLLREPLDTSEREVPPAACISTGILGGIWWGPSLCSCLRACLWCATSEL